jgi:hypothetical protein
MAALRRRERAQVEAAMTRFAGRGPVLLSSLAELDAAEFEQLLALLDEALAAPRAEDGSRQARTVDGALEVVLVPPAGERSWVSLAPPQACSAASTTSCASRGWPPAQRPRQEAP